MSDRETFLAHTRSILWRTWSTSSEELASAAVDTLMGLGMLVPEGGAAELARLQLLQNAQLADLSETQIDALADAGNRALNEHYHEDLCHCRDWPESCASSGNYFAGSWDTAAFGIGMAAVIGAWESMRAPAEADELARLRDRVAELEAAAAEPLPDTEGGVAFRQIGRTPSLQGLRTELRIEGFPPLVGRYSGAGMRRLDDRRELLLIEPALVFVRASLEDPHDSPLHHDYRLGHDLPEVPHA
ncbi:hypothetical protein ACFWNQ_15070 [Streptomyces virginiae]|uniref:hypothetical protein n=1 Tax=Streptomyces virginiae TaxID=1961 RepID=UPI00366A386F